MKKRVLLVTSASVVVIGSLYYANDYLIMLPAGWSASFLQSQAYHELVLLLFSALVIFVSRTLGTGKAIIVSLICALVVLPHALFFSAYPDPLYRVSTWFVVNVLLSLLIGGSVKFREQQRRYLRQIINAQEQERHRLSRELHDDTAQALIDVGHNIDGIMDSSAQLPEDFLDRLCSLRQQVDRILENTRRALQGLRPPLLEEMGLKPALLWLCENLGKDADIDIDTSIDLAGKALTPEMEMVLFRVTQEAFSNIKRHSYANKVQLQLNIYQGKIRLSITDDGIGFNPISRENLRIAEESGLIDMRERVHLVGGTLDVQSQPGNGTVLKVNIPLEIKSARESSVAQ